MKPRGEIDTNCTSNDDIDGDSHRLDAHRCNEGAASPSHIMTRESITLRRRAPPTNDRKLARRHVLRLSDVLQRLNACDQSKRSACFLQAAVRNGLRYNNRCTVSLRTKGAAIDGRNNTDADDNVVMCSPHKRDTARVNDSGGAGHTTLHRETTTLNQRLRSARLHSSHHHGEVRSKSSDARRSSILHNERSGGDDGGDDDVEHSKIRFFNTEAPSTSSNDIPL